MFRLDHPQPVRLCDGWRRRDFLRAGALGALGPTLPDFLRAKAAGAVDGDVNVIFVFLVGGPSQLDTWDMKPEAPSRIRGPYRPIRTNVRGIEVSEIFPRLARHADKYAILRSLHHEAAAVHDTGHQMMQTGRLFRGDQREPHFGSVAECVKGKRTGVPAQVLLPRPIGATGGDLAHGQDAGYLGSAYDPVCWDPVACGGGEPLGARQADRSGDWRGLIEQSVRETEDDRDPRLAEEAFHGAFRILSSEKARAAFDLTRESAATRARYGGNRFGQGCLLARRLVRAGVRFVTINMFETVFNEITWDIHGTSPFSPIEGYRDAVGPMFDRGFAALLEDLDAAGELDQTLVVATGEFGRTPKINPAGGRDHWPQCWSMLMAGGGVRGGQIVGASDAHGAEPRDRPIAPAEIAASVYHALGIDLSTELPGPNGPVPVVDPGVEPVKELFA